MNERSPNPKVTFVDVDADREGQRLDNFLLARLKGVPKSLVYRIVRKGEVRVNKGRARVDYRLKAGDVVRIPPVRIAQGSAPAPASQQLMRLLEGSILFENAGLMIVNKPSGLAVHGGSGINLGLIEVLRQMRPDERSLELVHRLDRDTSGCIMVAKKRSMLRYLHAQLRDGGVQKIYHALVAGRWPSHCREVNAPLKKNELSSGERMVRVDREGRPSLTEFRVLRRFAACTLVEARPITGRTHQIRVHAQFQGHPLIGDSKYGDDEASKRLRGKGVRRLFLHAAALTLTLPDEGGPLTVSAPLEEALELALEQIDER